MNVRYMVEDVDAAIEFYTRHLGFTLGTNASPAFADVTRGNLRLLLSGRKSSAGRPMPDGTLPFPGGWNRIELVFEDLASTVAKLKADGLHFRNEIITGPGGSQILLIDPSGNFMSYFNQRRNIKVKDCKKMPLVTYDPSLMPYIHRTLVSGSLFFRL